VHPVVEILGSLAAVITTLGWLPQLLKIRREKKADDISLVAIGTIATGVFLWTLYGLFIGSWPGIMANAVTFLFIVAIVGMKLHYGRTVQTGG